jgi:predicted metalloprotease
MLLEHCCSNRNRYSHGFSAPSRITIRLTRCLLFRINPNTDIRVRSDAVALPTLAGLTSANRPI